MAGENKVDASVVIPLSLTDFAKSLRELIGAFRDFAGLAGDGLTAVRRHEARQRANDLDFLAFPVAGLFGPVARIAKGHGAEDDFVRLERMLAETAEEVPQRVQSLRKYRDAVREDCGMAAANKLSELIDGPGGKFEIRYAIVDLIRSRQRGGSTEQLEAQANAIIEMIDAFNASLVELHDTIFPPRGAPK